MTEKYKVLQIINAPEGTRVMNRVNRHGHYQFEEAPLHFLALVEDANGRRIIVPLEKTAFGDSVLVVVGEDDVSKCVPEVLFPGHEPTKHHFQIGRDYI